MIKSTSNILWVKFASDGTVNKGGFQASFTKVVDECAARKNPCDHVCINVDGENLRNKFHLDHKYISEMTTYHSLIDIKFVIILG